MSALGYPVMPADLMRPPLRSTPPTTPSPYRYLGRGGGERPVRVQIILALVAALVLAAVPLYLWRRPQPASIPSADAATAPSGSSDGPSTSGFSLFGGIPGIAAGAQGGAGLVAGATGPGAGPRIEVSAIKTLKCQDPGPQKTAADRCDGVRFFEDSLARAIRESAACMPESKSGFVSNFVLEFHFGKKRTNLFFGKSTTLSKSKRKELLRCVEASLPTPDWDRIPHQHQKYTVSALATYPASDGAAGSEDAGRGESKTTSKPSSGGSKKPTVKPTKKHTKPAVTPKGKKKG